MSSNHKTCILQTHQLALSYTLNMWSTAQNTVNMQYYNILYLRHQPFDVWGGAKFLLPGLDYFFLYFLKMNYFFTHIFMRDYFFLNLWWAWLFFWHIENRSYERKRRLNNCVIIENIIFQLKSLRESGPIHTVPESNPTPERLVDNAITTLNSRWSQWISRAREASFLFPLSP